ncbi:MAG: helix-turn-helix domain-containing protein [Opitutaceae bacterium]
MKVKVIKSEADYEVALAHVATLMDAKVGSAKEEELDLWSMLIERYEATHHPIDPPDPIEAIKFRMEQDGLCAKDLEAYIPSKSKISEVLNRKRGLSLSMIRALSHGLGISADVLVQEPQGEYKRK